jgi:hypothetical protein
MTISPVIELEYWYRRIKEIDATIMRIGFALEL